MKKKEYIMPATKVKGMQHRLSLLAGSPESITSGGDGTEGDHAGAKEIGSFFYTEENDED